jgi:hypothetical protein
LRRFLVLGISAVILLSLAAASVLAQVEVHGYMQNRFYANPSASARFAVERISLSTVAKIGEDGNAYVELYLHPWLPAATAAEQYRTYVESAYVDLPFAQGRIRIGKGRQLNFGLTPSYPNRKISQYGIICETFTQDRIQGIQYAYKKAIPNVLKDAAFDFGASLFSDQNLGTRSAGEFPGATAGDIVKHVVDKDIPSDISGKLAVSAKIGVSSPTYQAHLSGAVGKLNVQQLGTVAPFVPAGQNNTNTDHSKFGVDVVFTQGPFVAQGEWYTGDFSLLGITGYQVLFGYQPKDKQRFYVRYSALNNDYGVNPNPTNPITWDIQQLTFSFVQPIRKGVWVEVNYEKNMERPQGGASSIKNDLLFLELFTGF